MDIIVNQSLLFQEGIPHKRGCSLIPQTLQRVHGHSTKKHENQVLYKFWMNSPRKHWKSGQLTLPNHNLPTKKLLLIFTEISCTPAEPALLIMKNE